MLMRKTIFSIPANSLRPRLSRVCESHLPSKGEWGIKNYLLLGLLLAFSLYVLDCLLPVRRGLAETLKDFVSQLVPSTRNGSQYFDSLCMCLCLCRSQVDEEDQWGNRVFSFNFIRPSVHIGLFFNWASSVIITCTHLTLFCCYYLVGPKKKKVFYGHDQHLLKEDQREGD